MIGLQAREFRTEFQKFFRSARDSQKIIFLSCLLAFLVVYYYCRGVSELFSRPADELTLVRHSLVEPVRLDGWT